MLSFQNTPLLFLYYFVVESFIYIIYILFVSSFIDFGLFWLSSLILTYKNCRSFAQDGEFTKYNPA